MISSFESIENKHDVYRGKDCMKKLYESLRELAMQMIIFFKKDNEAINKRAAGIIEKTVIFVNKDLKINI